MADRLDRPVVVFARPPHLIRWPEKPAEAFAMPRVVYAPKRRAGAALRFPPEITQQELARRGAAADQLMQEIKRQVGKENASAGADKLS